MFAVWYQSAGCLPDSEYPEYVGTLAECEEFILVHADDYARHDVIHDLYALVIDEYEPVEA